MSATLLAAALSACLVGADHSDTPHITYRDNPSARDKILLTQPPYPPNRPVSVRESPGGKLWHSRFPIGSRTPIREELLPGRGPAAYGAPVNRAFDAIYVNQNHVPIAINPWRTFDDDGLQKYRRARNIWLKENGWVGAVRTHVNPLYHQPGQEMYSDEMPKPRATIHLHDEPLRRPSEMRVEGPISGAPIERISRPHGASSPGARFTVVDHDRDALADAGEQPSED